MARTDQPVLNRVADLYDAGEFIDRLVVRGKRLTAQLAAGVIGADASVGIDTISEIGITIYDPGFDVLGSGLFDLGGFVALEGFKQEVHTIETGAAADGQGQVTLRCRSRAIGELRRRRGHKVMRHVSPSEFVKSECDAIGVKCVTQPSHTRNTVSRDVKSKTMTSSQDPPSSWSTFERLAQELGFVVFEAGNVIFFAEPTWLWARDDITALVSYNTGTGNDTVGVPQFTESLTSGEPLGVQFEVPRSRLAEMLPGSRVTMQFPPYAEEKYLVTALSFPISGVGNLSVTAGKPQNPKKEPPTRKHSGAGGTSGEKKQHHTGGGSGGGSKAGPATLGNLLSIAGFKGSALDTACGIAIAESGGYSSGRWYVKAHALGDVSLTDAKWGPSVGVFQIRSLRHPSAYSGVDKLRVQSKLMGPEFNAHAAYEISKGGTDWSAWSTYHSGAYKAGVGKTGAVVLGWDRPSSGGRKSGSNDQHGATHHQGGSEHHGGGGAPGSPRSASLFTSLCLKQAGDRYVYGAEVSLSNPNPSVWDCSELIQWAAHRAGAYMPDGSTNQLAYMRSKGTTMSVDAGLATRGAVLWIPGHVAVSLGGHSGTIEATNSYYGVRRWGLSRSFRWQAAGRVPGLRYG